MYTFDHTCRQIQGLYSLLMAENNVRNFNFNLNKVHCTFSCQFVSISFVQFAFQSI